MSNSVVDLSKYRFEQATQCVKSATILEENDDYKGAANRSYYAIFHAMRSVLALQKVDFAKHSGVSAYFRKEFIKTAVFDVKFSDIIRRAFDVRTESDYDDYYIISKEEVHEQIRDAEEFCNVIEQYLQEQYELLEN